MMMMWERIGDSSSLINLRERENCGYRDHGSIEQVCTRKLIYESKLLNRSLDH